MPSVELHGLELKSNRPRLASREEIEALLEEVEAFAEEMGHLIQDGKGADEIIREDRGALDHFK